MKDQLNTLNTYFWNVGNDIADIRLLAEGALALFEGDAEPLHRLGMKDNEEVAASAFDTIGTGVMTASAFSSCFVWSVAFVVSAVFSAAPSVTAGVVSEVSAYT